MKLTVLVSETEQNGMLHAWLQSKLAVSAKCPQYCTALLMFRQLHKLADGLLWSLCLVIHVCTHDTNWVPVGGLLWHLILRIFTKISHKLEFWLQQKTIYTLHSSYAHCCLHFERKSLVINHNERFFEAKDQRKIKPVLCSMYCYMYYSVPDI